MSDVTIHMTYMGSCSIGGGQVACTSMSANIEQKVQFFDHVLGLRDSLSGQAKSDSNSGGGTGNVQKRIYRYMPAVAKARMEGPIIDNGSFGSILSKAISGEEIDVNMEFWKNGRGVSITQARITSFTVSIKAGDVASFSCEVTGAGYEESASGGGALSCNKLITWDRCTVSGNVGDAVASLDVSISNPPIPIYTMAWGSEEAHGLMPQKIRLGIQEVSGTVGIFSDSAPSGTGILTFQVGTTVKTINVVYLPPTDTANGGQYIQTVGFVGAKDDPIWA